MERKDLESLKRIVIKVGSSTLTGDAGSGVNVSNIDAIVDLVAGLRAENKEVIVVSSGAIAAGLAPLGLTSRPEDLVTQQAAASVGQGRLIAHYSHSFERHKLIASQVLVTGDDMVRAGHSLNVQRTLNKLLELGVTPIINENDSVGVEEIRFGDNDRLGALVATLIGADLLILITDVDGLYDAPPASSGANRIAEIIDVNEMANIEIGGVGISGVGSGGMVTKIQAAKIVNEAGIAMLLTTLVDVPLAMTGANKGTVFHPLAQI